MVLDDVVRFIGQRVAAVVADSEAAAEEGCRRLVVDYEHAARRVRSGKSHGRRRAGHPRQGRRKRASPMPQRNIVAEVHGGIGDVGKGFAAADVIHEGSYFTPRIQHAHLETHCAIGWIDDDRPAQSALEHAGAVPHAAGTCRALRARSRQGARVLRARRRRLRRQAGNAGRGHRRARRAEDRQAGEARIHPRGAVHRRDHAASDARARQGGRQARRHAHRLADCASSPTPAPTAITARRCWNTPAPRASRVYRCANKKVDGYAVYTNTVPAGAFRGYGLPQTSFAVESAIDELARAIGMDAARIPPPQRGAAAATRCCRPARSTTT